MYACVCVSYRERAEKQRMYSVSQGLNSGGPTFLTLSKSADLARRRSLLWVWTWRSTCLLVLARKADSWIYQGNKHEFKFPLTHIQLQHMPEQHTVNITSLVEAAGPTLCVFLPAMSASFSPEPYRAKGCLLSLLRSLGCRGGEGLTCWDCRLFFEGLEGFLCRPEPLSTKREEKLGNKCQNSRNRNLSVDVYLFEPLHSFFFI